MFLYKAIVFLPLIGAIVAGLFGRAIGAKASEYLTSGLMIIAAVLSWYVFLTVGMGHHEGGPIKVEVLRWIQSGGIDVSWSLRVDTLTSVMAPGNDAVVPGLINVAREGIGRLAPA